MSHLKVLRGNFARRLLLNTPSRTQRKIKASPKFSILRRPLATQSATASQDHVLSSHFGEIEVTNECLTEHVFSDCEEWADKPSVTCGTSGRSYDYGMMRMLIDKCAKSLLSALKLSPGDRFGLILPNLPEFVVLIHGAMQAGLVVTFANPLYTADEVQRQFTNSDVKAIATIEMFMPVALEVSKALKDYKGTIWVGGDDDKAQGIFGLRSLLMADHEIDLPKLNADDVCLIPYSSGTTGVPKGVMLTHKNLVTNVRQSQCPKLMGDKSAKKVDKETVLAIPPFFHIYGFNGILNYNLKLGSHVVTMPRFTPEEYVKCLTDYKPSTLLVVPSLLTFLTNHPMVTKEHLAAVDTILVGAAPATDSIMENFLLKCEKTKEEMSMLQGYGMTESSPVTMLTPHNYPYSKVGSIGQLLPGTRAKVVSLTTGQTLGPHKSGELLIKGPQVMKGYWKNEKATKETLDSEGWLHTGDVCYYDEDHYFYIIDRTKELIKVKGNQVSPTELENIINELPGVADTAVVGIPDQLAGELPRAFVVVKQGAKITEKEVYDYVAKKLTKYKRLEGGVVFIDAIPRNVAGKILRNELKVLGYKKL